MARPLAITPEVTEKICAEIRAHQTFDVAIHRAGATPATFYRYMEKGAKAKRGFYREFRDKIVAADLESEAILVEKWKAKAFDMDDPKAIERLLEKRHRDRWGPTAQKFEHTGEVQGGGIALIQIISAVPRAERPTDPPKSLAARRLEVIEGGKAEVAGVRYPVRSPSVLIQGGRADLWHQALEGRAVATALALTVEMPEHEPATYDDEGYALFRLSADGGRTIRLRFHRLALQRLGFGGCLREIERYEEWVPYDGAFSVR